MKYTKILLVLFVFILFSTGCRVMPVDEEMLPHTKPPLPTNEPVLNPAPDGQGVLHFTVMIHLEGWDDGRDKDKFEKHAAIVREYADLFEKYGAVMTLESKEFTAGCIKWNDNVLKEMEDRGHGIGLHADQGGSREQSFTEFKQKVGEMKDELESLDVTVRHVSGVVSDKDWVKVCIDNGFEAATGVVNYGLLSLNENLRPEGFVEYETPMEGHGPYPWEPELTITPWRTSSGANWILHNHGGKLIIIPSGPGLTAAFEESQGNTMGGAGFDFNMKDIQAWRNKLDELMPYTDSGTVNTYYAAWSIGSQVDIEMLEVWLQMIDEYVKEGKIVWTNIPDMIDIYNASTN